jgi:hypothetical protein
LLPTLNLHIKLFLKKNYLNQIKKKFFKTIKIFLDSWIIEKIAIVPQFKRVRTAKSTGRYDKKSEITIEE